MTTILSLLAVVSSVLGVQLYFAHRKISELVEHNRNAQLNVGQLVMALRFAVGWMEGTTAQLRYKNPKLSFPLELRKNVEQCHQLLSHHGVSIEGKRSIPAPGDEEKSGSVVQLAR